jgi:hypothetical protein
MKLLYEIGWIISLTAFLIVLAPMAVDALSLKIFKDADDKDYVYLKHKAKRRMFILSPISLLFFIMIVVFWLLRK